MNQFPIANFQPAKRRLSTCCLVSLLLAMPILVPSLANAQAVAEPEAKNSVIKKANRPGDEARKSQGEAAQQDDKKDEKKKKKRPSPAEDFMRVRKDAKGRPVAMETSITRYELINEEGERITVDLIGVVHIGEKNYYNKLNKRFEQYESLLYELVAPEGTVIPKGGRKSDGVSMNPVAALQKSMQSALGLDFQLDHIDYTKKNFTHADMTPTEFGESMAKNDESVSKYALRAIGQSMAMQGAGKGGSNASMLVMLFSRNKEIKMSRMFADQMQQMEAGMVMFEGRDGSTIIDHRNAKCMSILDREIKSGKKNLAIFYGAGHLPDMERRLMSDFKMKRGGQNWLKAWNLEIPPRKSKSKKSADSKTKKD
jgi:hypothetical protein